MKINKLKTVVELFKYIKLQTTFYFIIIYLYYYNFFSYLVVSLITFLGRIFSMHINIEVIIWDNFRCCWYFGL